MKCVECGAWTVVLETRRGIRRRQCAGARGEVHEFRTREVVVGAAQKTRADRIAERDAAILEALARPGAKVALVARELELPETTVRRARERSMSKKGNP